MFYSEKVAMAISMVMATVRVTAMVMTTAMVTATARMWVMAMETRLAGNEYETGEGGMGNGDSNEGGRVAR